MVVLLPVHGGDEGVAGWRPKGVGLQFVLVYDVVSFGVEEGLAEETRS